MYEMNIENKETEDKFISSEDTCKLFEVTRV
jgi:hypothetical protein